MVERRSGMKLIYKCEPGESMKLLRSGVAIVTHPERPPMVVYPDGSKEVLHLGKPLRKFHQGVEI